MELHDTVSHQSEPPMKRSRRDVGADRIRRPACDGRTPLDLARAFQVPRTRRGLVRVAPNPDDGRSKCVWLTDEGRSFRDTAVAALAPDIAAIATRLPAAGLAEAMPVLTALRQLMDARRDG